MTDATINDADIRKRAAALLEVDESADIACLLRTVERQGYAVPAASIDAMQMLVNPAACAAQIESARIAIEEEQLTRKVEAFAANYFTIEPAERQRQWNMLVSVCSESRSLRSWLEDLQPALELKEIPESTDEDISTFIEWCCQVYVARGGRRARERQEFFYLTSAEPDRWEFVVRKLQELNSEFLKAVAPWINELQTVLVRARPVSTAPVPEAEVQLRKKKRDKLELFATFHDLVMVCVVVCGLAILFVLYWRNVNGR